MSDLIDRYAATHTALKFIVEYLGGAFDEDLQKKLMERMNDIPSAQPEPESAQWVQMFINRRMYKCSNCQVAWNKRLVFDNDGYSEKIFMKYCPCCGRKMRTEVDYE